MADNTTLNAGTGGDVVATDDIGGVKFQRIKLIHGADSVNAGDVSTTNGLPVTLRDTTGNAATSISDGAGGIGIGTSSMATNYVVSTVNSTTVQLAAGATFTGAIETVFNQQALSVCLSSDQASTITINEYIDAAGTRKCGSFTFTAAAGTGFNRAITANGNYYNVVVTNNGASATTTLNLNVAQGTLPPVTNLGNTPISINEVNGSAIANGRFGTIQLTGGPTSAALGLGSTVSPYGYVRATLEPGSSFYDPFDGAAIDTTNRWNTAVATGMSISQATGALTITTTTTVSNSLYIDTQPTFACEGLSFKIFGTAVKFEAQSANLFALNQHRYFGFGDRPTTFLATTPLGNAVGFELFTDGKLYACLYSGGTRIFSSATDLLGNTLNSLIVPSNGYVRFAVEMRADAIFWYVGATEYPAVKYDITTAGFSLPQLQALPIRIHAINAASGTVGASTFAFTAATVTDSGKNSTHLSDGTYHWRKASVGKQGGLKVSGASITGASGTIAAAGTGTVGPLDVSEAGTVTFIAKNTVAASAWAGAPVLVFEQSDDNVSWAPLTTVRSDTNAANSTFILGPNTASTSIMFDAALEGVNYVRCRVTTGPTTNGMTISIQPGGLAFTPIVSVIERKDAGRLPFVWYTESLAGAIAEALVTMTAVTAVGTTGTAATTYTVPAGKTLRLTSMQVSFVSTSTTANTTKLRIRALASGAALVTSPIIWSTPRIGWPSATFIANEVTTLNFDFPDGFEFAAGNSIGLTHIEAAANGTVDVMITGFLY